MNRFVIATLVATAAIPVIAQETIHLTLKAAEQLALQNNPRVTSAQFTAAAAHEVPKEYASAYQPTVFGALTGAGATDGSRIAAGGLNNPVIYDRFATGVGVSQLISDFGRTGNLVGSANFAAKAQDENSVAVRARVLLTVDEAYFQVLRAQAVLKVAQQTVDARLLVADQINALAKNALKSQLDVSFANVNLQEARLLLAGAQSDVKAAVAALSTALGFPGQRSFTLEDEPMPDAPPDQVRPLIEDAIRNRPELASLRAQKEAANRFTKAESDLRYPSVGVVGMAGLVPTGVAALGNNYSAIGLNVNIPILNGGLYKARRTEAELRARSVSENVRDEQNLVVRDVETAWLNATTAYEKVNLTKQLLDQAQLGLDLAQSRYNLGLGSIIELSQAQLNLTSAQITTTTARYDYQRDWSALQFQTGNLR